jgi:mono/diheme cytochrome c family protein/roadblock/LC7 domain-containing protein
MSIPALSCLPLAKPCPVMRRNRFLAAFLLVSASACDSFLRAADESAVPESVSYHEHIRPLFQAKCQGCHQPAKAKGDYNMTEVTKLIAGGESGAAVVPAKPDESYLIELVTQQPGEDRPEMPPKDEPLTSRELAMVRKWIEQGAKDDTPENARQRYDQQNPPQYAEPPVITSLDFSPDGKLIAVAGFHEVLLHKADGSGLVARLVGLSERIESARFSPDGKRLAVAGGLPGRMGEIQIWDVEKRELILSKPVGYDTAYGASWSPDGKFIAFGLPDNTVRAIDAETGNQTLFMGSHSDWVLDTVWSEKGDHLVSVARDMSAKLTNVPTERFVDNVTSITPGALKGGMNTVVRHPKTDHILVGGSDGVPQIYRMHRETARKIGDNANLIRKYPAMEGRIWSVAFAPDGKRFAAVSSLNGQGMVNFYKSEYDATISPELKKAFETANRQVGGKDDIVELFHTQGAELLKSVKIDDAALFSVAFSPDGKSGGGGLGRRADPPDRRRHSGGESGLRARSDH